MRGILYTLPSHDPEHKGGCRCYKVVVTVAVVVVCVGDLYLTPALIKTFKNSELKELKSSYMLYFSLLFSVC